uniref:Uncharacterized protein n=1 Tax=Rhizophora mucronata TaxID=61149 RepID=A0A2P2PB94_RHIMU
MATDGNYLFPNLFGPESFPEMNFRFQIANSIAKENTQNVSREGEERKAI